MDVTAETTREKRIFWLEKEMALYYTKVKILVVQTAREYSE